MIFTATYYHPEFGEKTQTIVAYNYRSAVVKAEALLTGENGGELKGYFLRTVDEA